MSVPQPGCNASSSVSASFHYTKSQRLLNAADFREVFSDAPVRAAHPQFLILARRNGGSQARLGLVIAKKHVKKAVHRNRIKRAARESFRLNQHKLPPIDAIVLARHGADTVPPEQLNSLLTGLWKRIIKRATTPGDTA